MWPRDSAPRGGAHFFLPLVGAGALLVRRPRVIIAIWPPMIGRMTGLLKRPSIELLGGPVEEEGGAEAYEGKHDVLARINQEKVLEQR